MAWLLLAAACALVVATGYADRRPHTSTGVFTSDRVDLMVGTAWMVLVIALLASIAF